MLYRLRISGEAAKQIDRLPGYIKHRIGRIIAGLRSNPRPAVAQPLRRDLTGLYRIKLEDWRIIYSVVDDEVVVEIIRVGRRDNDTYEDLL